MTRNKNWAARAAAVCLCFLIGVFPLPSLSEDLPEPTQTPIAEPTETPTAEPTVKPFKVKATAGEPGCYVGDKIVINTVVKGGVEPYDISITLLHDGEVVNSKTKAGKTVIKKAKFGKYVLKISATDATGKSASAKAVVRCASHDTETKWKWEHSFGDAVLTGDAGADLLEIARTQVGYHESKKDFHVDNDGSIAGYTRYGDWFGRPYGEWCCMFVSFCANYAGISEDIIPHLGSSSDMKDRTRAAYHARKDDYVPEPGDLVFFDVDKNGGIDHIGIVDYVEDDGTLHTIEGNSGAAVTKDEYKPKNKKIVGFSSIRELVKITEEKAE